MKEGQTADIELEPVETVVEQVVPAPPGAGGVVIPDMLLFEEAVELATNLAPDGHLPENIYNDIIDRLAPESHVEFSLALASCGVIVVPPMAPPDAEGLREARRIVLGKVENGGSLDEETYRDLLARFGPGTGIYLNQWIIKSGIPIAGDYKKDLKKKIPVKPKVKTIHLTRRERVG
jgi:hypothetical protein